MQKSPRAKNPVNTGPSTYFEVPGMRRNSALFGGLRVDVEPGFTILLGGPRLVPLVHHPWLMSRLGGCESLVAVESEMAGTETVAKTIPLGLDVKFFAEGGVGLAVSAFRCPLATNSAFPISGEREPSGQGWENINDTTASSFGLSCTEHYVAIDAIDVFPIEL